MYLYAGLLTLSLQGILWRLPRGATRSQTSSGGVAANRLGKVQGRGALNWREGGSWGVGGLGEAWEGRNVISIWIFFRAWRPNGLTWALTAW